MSASFRRIPLFAITSLTALGALACQGAEPKATTTSAGAVTPSASTPGSASPGAPSVTARAVAITSSSYDDGDAAFRAGRYAEAAAIFSAYSERHPTNPWGHYMTGLAAWKSGDPTRAIEGFDRALALDSAHVKSLLNSSRVYLELNQPVQALERIERAVAVDSSADAFRLLGRVRYVSGDVDGAIGAYRRALVVDERDVWAMNNLGLVYLEQGRPEEALAPLARAVELRSNAPVFLNNLGIALERTGHYAAARESFERALAADSTYGKASVSLARVSALVEADEGDAPSLGDLAGQFEIQIRTWSQPEPETLDTVEQSQPAAPQGEPKD